VRLVTGEPLMASVRGRARGESLLARCVAWGVGVHETERRHSSCAIV
jgi:hypothetical protein